MPDDLTALRDRLAGLCGWLHMTAYGVWIHPKISDDERGVTHPFPPGDLTALAAAWPEGWNYRMEMFSGWWYGAAQRDDGNVETWRGPYTERAPTEYEARLRLTVAVREAMRDG